MDPKLWHSTYLVDKTWLIGRLRITFDIRRADGIMSRFGGGWHWALGIRVGSTSIYIQLIVAEIMLSWRKP